jgi:hypothetical protein
VSDLSTFLPILLQFCGICAEALLTMGQAWVSVVSPRQFLCMSLSLLGQRLEDAWFF